ncbi:MucBP domain-containing protein [Vagococcus coleopterorum]|uniref:MucBP domain-containing protein n=1 Tax=Vagococcus coleopterorum TaxID=2714946 RepID=A0A6G8ALE5_9ENTE|nr:MucBP domain-containing protein [Vagococcus coleopterorum]QIL45800.1 MucBP domain-containing protein [Vagococcus coleopterorum]
MKIKLLSKVLVLACFLGVGTLTFAKFYNGESGSRAAPSSYDWEKFNKKDGLDLSSYKEVNVNTPVKLEGDFWGPQDRNYYLFFGKTTMKSFFLKDKGDFETKGVMYAPLGNKKKLPLLGGNIIGVSKSGKSKIAVFNYTYDQGQTPNGGLTASYDIGELLKENGPVAASNKLGGSGTATEQDTYIVKQYVKKNDIVAYGWAERTDKSWMPIRIHYYYNENNNNKISMDLSFGNESKKDKYFVNTYSSHMDVGGAHKASKMYSNGEDGIYFNQKKTPVDKLDAQVLFYMGKKNYGDKNGPTMRKLGNLGSRVNGIGHWDGIHNAMRALYGKALSVEEPLANWDKTDQKGYNYPLNHPVFVLGWDPIFVKQGEIGEMTLDILVKEQFYERKLQVDYIDTKGRTLAPSKNLVLNDTDYYDEKPLDLGNPDYHYFRVAENSDPVSGKMDGDKHVIFVYAKEIGEVEVHYEDVNGKKIADDLIVEDEVGEPYHVKPIEIDGFEYIKTVGNPSGVMSRTVQEVTFVYRSNTYFMHLRQVILSADNTISLPNSGRLVAWNTKDQSTSDVASKTNLSINSGVGDVSYSDVEVTKKTGYNFLLTKPTVPSLYQYVGSVVTKSNVPHDPASKNPDIPTLLLTDGTEYWVTLYLEPTSNTSVYLNVVNDRLNVYYSNVSEFTVYIDGKKYKKYKVANTATVESQEIDVPIDDMRNKISVKYKTPDGKTAISYWSDRWDFVEDDA